MRTRAKVRVCPHFPQMKISSCEAKNGNEWGKSTNSPRVLCKHLKFFNSFFRFSLAPRGEILILVLRKQTGSAWRQAQSMAKKCETLNTSIPSLFQSLYAVARTDASLSLGKSYSVCLICHVFNGAFIEAVWWAWLARGLRPVWRLNTDGISLDNTHDTSSVSNSLHN